MFGRSSGVILLPLPGVHKLTGEPVAIMYIVSAAAPQPITRQVTGSSGTTAATGGELSLTTGSAYGVDHTGRTDGICERCLSGA